MSTESILAEAMAYVDGELDGIARRAFEIRMAVDPALAQVVEREQSLRNRIAAAFDPVLDEPVPDRLRRLLDVGSPGAEPVVELGALRSSRAAATAARRWRAQEWGALAAAVLIATAAGISIGRLDAGQPLVVAGADGGWQAGGALDRALTSQLAADSGADATIRVGLSFAARDGRWCRAFSSSGSRASAGLACRDNDRWRVEVVAPGAPAAGGDYRPASSGWPPAILQAIDERRTGDPLDAAGERAARDRGWRR